jgi:hypothetical protein
MMNIFSFAYFDYEGRALVLVRAPEKLVVDRKKKDQRDAAIENYEKVFPNHTVILFHEDKWGVKAFQGHDNPLTNRLASCDISNLVWQTYDMDK